MGDFTKAVFSSKELFTEELMAEFGQFQTRQERITFVNKYIPSTITNFLNCSDTLKSSGRIDKTTLPAPEIITTLHMAPHSKFPCLSEAVSVKYTDQRGRFVVANRQILRGEIVAVESPIVKFPIVKESEDYCNMCSRNISLTGQQPPIKCDLCRNTFWCSEKCQNEARSSHHQYECNIGLSDLMRQGHPGLGKLFMIFRIFSQSQPSWFKSRKNMLINHSPERGTQSEDCITTSIETIFNLARHEPTDTAKLLEVSIVGLVFVRMLTKALYFGEMADNALLSEDQLLIAELICILIPAINVNTHPVPDVQSEYQSKNICAAIYPVVASLFNHSCDPSLIRATLGDQLVIAAGIDIPEGGELTDMYTVHWTEYTTDERRAYLERVFHFTCDCTACQEGWEPEEEGEDWNITRRDLDIAVQKRLVAHDLRGHTEYKLMNLISGMQSRT